MAYATLEEFKVWVGIPVLDDTDDDTLQLALDAASGQIDAYCDRTFTVDETPTVRVYSPDLGGILTVDPISSTTGLVVATDDNNDGTYETTWTLGVDYRLDPPNAAAYGEAYTRLVALGTRWFPRLRYRPSVQVTALFGWPGDVPAAVKEAALLQAALLWKRKDAPFGVAGSVELGSEMRILSKLDPNAQDLLRPFRRHWWFA